MSDSDDLVSLAALFELKCAHNQKDFLSPNSVESLKLSVQDLNRLYDKVKNGNTEPGDESTIHWVIKRIDSILWGLNDGGW